MKYVKWGKGGSTETWKPNVSPGVNHKHHVQFERELGSIILGAKKRGEEEFARRNEMRLWL